MAMSNLTIQKIVDERVEVTIVNLLPIEMLASVKSMCAKICTKRISVKCQAWLKEKASDISKCMILYIQIKLALNICRKLHSILSAIGKLPKSKEQISSTRVPLPSIEIHN